MSGKGEAWKKYINYYPQLLMYPIEDYPYKELAEKFGLNVANVQHMVNYIKTQPDVIAFLRSTYSPESLPDWVGDLDGVDDYRQFLEDRGFDVSSLPAAVSDDSDDSDDVSDDESDDTDYDDDVADGVSVEEVPVQRVATVANNIETGAPRVIQAHTGAPRQRQTGTQRDTGVYRIIQTQPEIQKPTQKQAQPETPVVKQQAVPLRTKLPEPILKPKDVAIPFKVVTKQDADKSTDKPSKARVVLQDKMGSTQAHDPSLVQLPGGGWGKIKENASGQKIIEAADEPSMMIDSMMDAAVSEVTQEELKVTALALMKKVALAPSVILGHAYLTTNVNPETGQLFFKGDVGDFVNYCVRWTLKYGFGTEVAILSGGKTLTNFIREANN